jgi:hypothetical protein
MPKNLKVIIDKELDVDMIYDYSTQCGNILLDDVNNHAYMKEKMVLEDASSLKRKIGENADGTPIKAPAHIVEILSFAWWKWVNKTWSDMEKMI